MKTLHVQKWSAALVAVIITLSLLPLNGVSGIYIGSIEQERGCDDEIAEWHISSSDEDCSDPAYALRMCLDQCFSENLSRCMNAYTAALGSMFRQSSDRLSFCQWKYCNENYLDSWKQCVSSNDCSCATNTIPSTCGEMEDSLCDWKSCCSPCQDIVEEYGECTNQIRINGGGGCPLPFCPAGGGDDNEDESIGGGGEPDDEVFPQDADGWTGTSVPTLAGTFEETPNEENTEETPSSPTRPTRRPTVRPTPRPVVEATVFYGIQVKHKMSFVTTIESDFFTDVIPAEEVDLYSLNLGVGDTECGDGFVCDYTLTLDSVSSSSNEATIILEVLPERFSDKCTPIHNEVETYTIPIGSGFSRDYQYASCSGEDHTTCAAGICSWFDNVYNIAFEIEEL